MHRRRFIAGTAAAAAAFHHAHRRRSERVPDPGPSRSSIPFRRAAPPTWWHDHSRPRWSPTA